MDWISGHTAIPGYWRSRNKRYLCDQGENNHNHNYSSVRGEIIGYFHKPKKFKISVTDCKRSRPATFCTRGYLGGGERGGAGGERGLWHLQAAQRQSSVPV